MNKPHDKWTGIDIAMRTYASNDNWQPGAPETEPSFHHDYSSGPWKHENLPRKEEPLFGRAFFWCASVFVACAATAWGLS